MSIRVGRKKHLPRIDGWTPVEVMTKSSAYGKLSPYCLKDEKGQIMENIWQFSKVYETIPYTRQFYSRFDRRVIWEHPPQKHFDKVTNYLTPDYWDWRAKGFSAREAIRYPVGYAYRHRCLFALKDDAVSGPVSEDLKLDYVQARKEIYVPLYQRLVRRQPLYRSLLARVRKGEKLLIIEVDGPHQESLDYYKTRYQVADDFITDHTVAANLTNMQILLNDTRHPFGHGYCLAWALLEDLKAYHN